MTENKLRLVSLCFLVRPGEVLLAMKKRGFGQGLWNGIGGKQDPGETLEQTLLRETNQEIGVTLTRYRPVAVINFYFPEVPVERDWNQQARVFLADQWEGEPQETEEMAPKWFPVTELPLQQMWVADREWIPRILAGETLAGRISFGGEGESVISMQFTPITL